MINKYNPEKHHRRSIRLRDYDYSQTGAYFVTICSWNRECIFGDILDGDIRLNEFGQIVKKEWLQTGDIRHNLELDEFIIMPNHIHGIIVLNDIVGATRRVARNWAIHRIAPTLQSNSIGSIIGQFKSIVSKQINLIRNTPGFPVWQRNYYEHIIRNEDELNRVREYIINNPLQWADDENNPLNIKKCRGEALPRP
jgi:putative transposase